VVGEAEVGDPVGRRVRKLLAAADGSWRGGGAHGARRGQGRRRTRVRGVGGGGGGLKFERATSEASTRGGRLDGLKKGEKQNRKCLGKSIFLDSKFEPRPREAEWGVAAGMGRGGWRREGSTSTATAWACLPTLDRIGPRRNLSACPLLG